MTYRSVPLTGCTILNNCQLKKDEVASFGGYADQLDDSLNAPRKRISLGPFLKRICNHSSIFTAEAEGIIYALKHIKVSPKIDGKFVIFSDSKSVLESVQSQNSNNVTMQELNELIQIIFTTILIKSLRFRLRICS